MSQTKNHQLSTKQFMFVEKYCENGEVATSAAEFAGYSSPGSAGHQLLKNPKIQKAIEKYRKGTQVLSVVELNKTLEQLANIAFSDVRELFDEQGRLLPPSQWSDRAAAAVASFDVVTKQLGAGEVEYVAKVKSVDKMAALDKIMRHLGAYNDKLTLEHDVSAIEERLKEGRKRVANLRVVGEQ